MTCAKAGCSRRKPCAAQAPGASPSSAPASCSTACSCWRTRGSRHSTQPISASYRYSRCARSRRSAGAWLRSSCMSRGRGHHEFAGAGHASLSFACYMVSLGKHSIVQQTARQVLPRILHSTHLQQVRRHRALRALSRARNQRRHCHRC